jgi:hypothetical protein
LITTSPRPIVSKMKGSVKSTSKGRSKEEGEARDSADHLLDGRL